MLRIFNKSEKYYCRVKEIHLISDILKKKNPFHKLLLIKKEITS